MPDNIAAEWSPQGDPMMALLPEPPWAFQRLPLDEQKWRARAFLMTYILTGHLAFSWAAALNDDAEHVAEVKAILSTTDDEELLYGLKELEVVKAARAAASA